MVRLLFKTCKSFLIILLIGGGGVGKSFLINLVKMWAEYILRQPGDHPLKPKVLLLGPTGMAANLIGKNFQVNWSELF